MREIFNLQLGQCGNSIGTKFWEIIAHEHSINNNTGIYEGENDLQLQRIDVYFNSGYQGKYVPRSLMIDLDSSSLDYIKNSNIGGLFSSNQFVGGASGGSNNYAKGFYTDGSILIDQIMELIRLEVENCDMLQGFQMFHSLGGGTGAGLGSLVLSKILEEWPDRIIITMSIMPAYNVSEAVLEPYNCLLGIKSLTSMSDETVLYDNESLSRICLTKLKKENVTYSDMHHLIGNTVSTITSSLRFPGQQNSDLRKIAVNMVPFPELHFFISSYSPLGQFDNLYKDGNVKTIIKDLFRDGNIMVTTNSGYGKYITATVIVRGHVSTKDVEETIANIQDKRHKDFVDYIPSNISSAICNINPHRGNVTAASLGNHSDIASLFGNLHNRFGIMFNRQAYLHWYTAEGLEISEFRDSSESLMNVMNKYQAIAGKSQLDYKLAPNDDHGFQERPSEKYKTNVKYLESFAPAINNENSFGNTIAQSKTIKKKDLESLSLSISEEKSILNVDSNAHLPTIKSNDSDSFSFTISDEKSLLKNHFSPY